MNAAIRLPFLLVVLLYLFLTFFSFQVWAETLSLPASEKKKTLEMDLQKENDDAAILESADGYAAKGFYYFAINEAKKVPETSPLYPDAVTRIVAWARNMQSILASNYDNGVTTVRNSPILITQALFTKNSGPLEVFNTGQNNPKLELEILSTHKLTVKELQFKILCFDALDELASINKGIYIAKAENLDLVPLNFRKLTFDLKDMGNIQRVKIRLISVVFADGSKWEAPPEIVPADDQKAPSRKSGF